MGYTGSVYSALGHPPLGSDPSVPSKKKSTTTGVHRQSLGCSCCCADHVGYRCLDIKVKNYQSL